MLQSGATIAERTNHRQAEPPEVFDKGLRAKPGVAVVSGVESVAELLAALSSPDVETRIESVAQLAEQPNVARPLLACALLEPSASLLARVWCMIAIAIIEDDDEGSAAHALVECLGAPEAIIRRCAIDTLGELKVEWAIPALARHLSDHAAIDSGWFGDASTPAQAARLALESMGTEDALQALARVMVH